MKKIIIKNSKIFSIHWTCERYRFYMKYRLPVITGGLLEGVGGSNSPPKLVRTKEPFTVRGQQKRFLTQSWVKWHIRLRASGPGWSVKWKETDLTSQATIFDWPAKSSSPMLLNIFCSVKLAVYITNSGLSSG